MVDRFRGLVPHQVSTILLLLPVIALLPILLILSGIFINSIQSARNTAISSNIELAQSVGATFQAFVTDVVNQELAIGRATLGPNSLPPDSINAYLAAQAEAYPAVLGFGIINPQGTFIFNNDPSAVGVSISDESFFQAIVQGATYAVAPVAVGRVTGAINFVIVTGIRDENGQLLGVVLTGIDPQDPSIVSLPLPGTTSRNYSIYDNTGRLAFHQPPLSLTFEQRGALANNPLLQRALAGEIVGGVLDPNIADQRVLVGFAPIQPIGWVAGASIDESEALAPAVDTARVNSVLIVIVALISFFAAWLASRYITAPLSRLRAQAIALGRGELETRDSISGPSELRDLSTVFNHMANQIQARSQENQSLLDEIQRRAAVLESVFSSMVDIVYVVDLQKQLILANKAGLELLAISDTNEFNRYPAVIIERLNIRHPDGSKLAPKEFPDSRALRGELIRQLDLLIYHKQQHHDLSFRVSAAPIRYESMRIWGAVVVLRDVTELVELDKLKDEFIAVTAHELRTPVAIMKGYAQALGRGKQVSPESQQKMYQAIDRGANRIEKIVQDLMDISNLQLGTFDLTRESLDLRELVENTVNSIAATSPHHRIRVTRSHIAIVEGDAKRLTTVLVQLINNAIIYSPKGGDVDVTIETSDTKVTVAVKDYGVGIPKPKQGHIFERFYRAHMGTPYDFGGMGVGLYISKQIITKLRGTMGFHSEEGKGSTFWFSLPYQEDIKAPTS